MIYIVYLYTIQSIFVYYTSYIRAISSTSHGLCMPYLTDCCSPALTHRLRHLTPTLTHKLANPAHVGANVLSEMLVGANPAHIGTLYIYIHRPEYWDNWCKINYIVIDCRRDIYTRNTPFDWLIMYVPQ